jgi:hypothetical protein
MRPDPISCAVRARLTSLVEDPDQRVRYQLAFTLGELPELSAAEGLAAVARQDAAEPWMRLAVLSSSLGRAGTLCAMLAAESRWRVSAEARLLLGQLAEQAGLQGREDQVAEVLAALETLGSDETGPAPARCWPT